MQLIESNKKNISYLFIIIFILFVIAFNIIKKRSYTNTHKIRIAYSNDLTGYIIEKIKNNKNINNENIEYIDFGDCCGAYSQFAFANNQVDIAILCPDAVNFLKELGKNYQSLGTLLYDSDILVYKTDNIKNIKTVAYMTNRFIQEETLKKFFNNNVDIVSMTTSAIGYAMENNLIDAALVDCMTYLRLPYKGISITNNLPSQELVIQNDKIIEKQLNEFVILYNNEINAINKNEEILLTSIGEEIEDTTTEELYKKWKAVDVKLKLINLTKK